MPSPIISVHLADVGPVRALRTSVTGARALRSIAGLRHADVLTAAPLGPGLLPRPRLGRVGLVAVWEQQAALQDFERSHPFAARLTDSFAGHFTVPRAVGAFAGMTPLADAANSPHKPAAGPVGALTYGQLRPSRALAFLKATPRPSTRPSPTPPCCSAPDWPTPRVASSAPSRYGATWPECATTQTPPHTPTPEPATSTANRCSPGCSH